LEIYRNVLVIGGGIAGVQASLDLAEQGNKVYLVEKSPSIGGHMAQLDKTFPTNDCSICILAPKMVECARHPNIRLLTYSELESAESIEDGFKIRIRRKERYVNEEKCTGCNQCSEICPVKVPNEFDCGLRLRSAIYIPFAQAVPNIAILDKDACIQCRSCIKTCPASAIEFDNSPEGKIIELQVSSVIIATGFDLIDPNIIKRYKYGEIKNVITALEFERLMSASGPSGGRIIRLSDGKPAEKIVIIHCVGSRNIKFNRYCSRICCMYATKEAIIAKEHNPNIEIEVLFNDMRAYGKGFQEYVERAQEEYNIRYIRAYPSEVESLLKSGKVRIYYENINTGKIEKTDADLIVLCTSIIPSKSTKEIARIFGIETNEIGFFKSKSMLSPVRTSKERVYMIGACESPKDIPDSVADASAGAALACVSDKNQQMELDLKEKLDFKKNLRIGVFICHCGTNIAGVVDVNKILNEVKTVPGVVYASTNLYTCSIDTQNNIKNIIKDFNLNRLVVAACTPRTHEKLFRNTCKEAGLNPYLFEFANIREQCSWVHINEPVLATEKAIDLVKMAISRAKYLEPQLEIKVKVNQSALIIGGGVSGLSAARLIASKGIEVYLIEKKEQLGGYLNKLHRINNNLQDPINLINKFIDEITKYKNCKIYLGAEIEEIEGSIGNFKVKIKNNSNNEIILNPGVIIVAIGAREFVPESFFNYGRSKNIYTQTEFHNLLKSENGIKKLSSIEKIAFIQCVGSRMKEGLGVTYCSAICCSNTLRLVKYIKSKFPKIEPIILYRDINVYGDDEQLYREIRGLGVLFIRYTRENQPKVMEKDDKFIIRTYTNTLNCEVKIIVDNIVLATPLMPAEDTEKISNLIKVPRSYNGFFLEAHIKHRPLDFATDGIYLCGTCQSPRTIKESISQGLGAASRALIPLLKGTIKSEPIIATVNKDLCITCEICELTCPFNAIKLEEISKNDVKAVVNPILCKGCGACAAACPAGAISMKHFTDEQIISMVQTALKTKKHEPRIIAFLCNWCSYAGADDAGVSRFQYAPNVRIIRLMCSGRVSIKHILEAFKAGADGVLVSGCNLGECHYLTGNFQAQRRVEMAKIILKYTGINPVRLQLSWCSASEGKLFAKIINEFKMKIDKLYENDIMETIKEINHK